MFDPKIQFKPPKPSVTRPILVDNLGSFQLVIL